MHHGLGELLNTQPYTLDAKSKKRALDRILGELTVFHFENCEKYRRILEAWPYDAYKSPESLSIPYLPVRLFKEFDLKSVSDENIIKTMTSSGTTGQNVSRIFLDKDTATNQTIVLGRIVSDFLGTRRLPMIIVDSSAVLRDRVMFGARGAGILGFSFFGYDKIYALDDNLVPQVDKIEAFLEKHREEKVFLFGFTFMIWKYLLKEILDSGKTLDLSNCVLVHGGGWKKLLDQQVNNNTFKSALKSAYGLLDIHNFYGMVEQTGSIYMECEQGHLHASVFSDVIIRNPKDFSVNGVNSEGLIEVLSVLPASYPGHVLLTEDRGVLLGEDDCPCGRKGKYFKVTGRIEKAEIRGCSDIYAV